MSPAGVPVAAAAEARTCFPTRLDRCRCRCPSSSAGMACCFDQLCSSAAADEGKVPEKGSGEITELEWSEQSPSTYSSR